MKRKENKRGREGEREKGEMKQQKNSEKERVKRRSH